MPQILVPMSVLEAGGWVGSAADLANPNSAGMVSPYDPTAANACRVRLVGGAAPSSPVGHRLHVTAAKSAIGGNLLDLHVDILNGGDQSLIASMVLSSLSTPENTWALDIDPTLAARLVDAGLVELRFYAAPPELGTTPTITYALPTANRGDFVIQGTNFGAYVSPPPQITGFRSNSATRYLHAYNDFTTPHNLATGLTSGGFRVSQYYVNPVTGEPNISLVANTRLGGSNLCFDKKQVGEYLHNSGYPAGGNYAYGELNTELSTAEWYRCGAVVHISCWWKGTTGAWWNSSLDPLCTPDSPIQSGKIFYLIGKFGEGPAGANGRNSCFTTIGGAGSIPQPYAWVEGRQNIAGVRWRMGPEYPELDAEHIIPPDPTTGLPPNPGITIYGTNAYPTWNLWHRMDWFLRDHPTYDDLSLYCDLHHETSMRSATGPRRIAYPFVSQYRYFGALFCHQQGEARDNGFHNRGTHQADALYVAYSYARVELGDHPIFASCTKREIQPVTSWAANQVSAQFQRGTFTPGSTAYLFVVTHPPSVLYHEDAPVSAGYPVQVP